MYVIHEFCGLVFLGIFSIHIKMYLNETYSEIQIGRHFSDAFRKGLKEGVITLSRTLEYVIKRSKQTSRV